MKNNWFEFLQENFSQDFTSYLEGYGFHKVDTTPISESVNSLIQNQSESTKSKDLIPSLTAKEMYFHKVLRGNKTKTKITFKILNYYYYY
jgi:hypothetical protein